jgi:hypothetical protein
MSNLLFLCNMSVECPLCDGCGLITTEQLQTWKISQQSPRSSTSSCSPVLSSTLQLEENLIKSEEENLKLNQQLCEMKSQLEEKNEQLRTMTRISNVEYKMQPTGVNFENYVCDQVREIVKELGLKGTVTNCSKIKHCGDVMYISKNGKTKLIIDAKEGKTMVAMAHYEKLQRDMKTQNAQWGILVTKNGKVGLGNGKPILNEVHITPDNIIIISGMENNLFSSIRALQLGLVIVENYDEELSPFITSSHDLKIFFQLCPKFEMIAKQANELSIVCNDVWNEIYNHVLHGKKLKKMSEKIIV